MGLEIFQKLVEEILQKGLQQMDLKQKSIVEIFGPTPTRVFPKKSFSKYIDKTQQQLIFTIEDEFSNKTPRAVVRKIYPLRWHF